MRFNNVLSLAFVVSSFRVTIKNLYFETVQSGPSSFFCIFSLLLKEFTCFHCSWS